jgi:hypothetical protein
MRAGDTGHNTPAQSLRIESVDLGDPVALVRFVEDLTVSMNGILAKAQSDGNASTAISANRELRSNAELLLQLRGALGKGNGTPINDERADERKATALIAELTTDDLRALAHSCSECSRLREEALSRERIEALVAAQIERTTRQ